MKKLLAVFITTALLLCGCGQTTNVPSAENTPEATEIVQPTAKPQPTPKVYTEVIEISTAEELAAMSADYALNGNGYEFRKYVLTNDIDLSSVGDFIPIGKNLNHDGYGHYPSNYQNDDYAGFCSWFDGQGYTIKNITINYNGDETGRWGEPYAGLFAVISPLGVVENVTVENITINGIGRNEFSSSDAGGFAAVINGGTVRNCHTQGTVTAAACSGGFVGRLYASSVIENCSADIDLTGTHYIGGFVGYNDTPLKNSQITNCSSYGSVTAYMPDLNSYLDIVKGIGGFVGFTMSGTYTNCHVGTRLYIMDNAMGVGAFAGITDNQRDKVFFKDCTYNPDVVGEWYMINLIDWKNTHGNYGNNTFISSDKQFEQSVKDDYGIDADKIVAVSKDSRYFIYESNSDIAGDGGEIEYTLKDTQSDKEKQLGKVLWSRNSGAGFFQNGDVYIFDEYSGLKVFDTNMDSSNAIFDSQTNFPCGDNIDGNGAERYVFAVRRDPVNMDYIVIYGEFNDIDCTHTKYPYRIGLLDKEGRLMQTHQLPVEFDTSDFYEMHMFKSNDTEIEFYAVMKDSELFRARFDYATAKFTQIK
ncbi:MAG: hypothetical protein IKA10_06490 [Oscillospiraceae bacterium]|nr:hypothetical protein [Oscillospiraceae bacterium]